MKNITISFQALVAIVVAIAALSVGGTLAYYSDTETSTHNTIYAGAIDLTVDNESYVTAPDGALVFNNATSWLVDNITDQLFFAFDDVKPGDVGEDTISLHVHNNDSWACMDVTLTATPENGQTEPEQAVDNTAGEDEGELQDALYFAFWADDGDNVYEEGETIFEEGFAAELFAADDTQWALADSTGSVFGDGSAAPLTGDEVYYIAKHWCFGDMGEDPVAQDGIGKTGTGTGDSTNGPLVRGTGFTCVMNADNSTQTDGIVVDVSFYTEQSRNNQNFTCPNVPQNNKVACTLQALPTVISDDESSTLIWTTTNATSFEIDQSVGAVTPVAGGNTAVSPDSTTTYTGTATGPDGTAQCEATITVTPENAYTISATKVVCEDESDLPNWGAGGPDITATTAIDFVNEHPGCHLQEGQVFEWAPRSLGVAPSNIEHADGYTLFEPTNSQGVATYSITTYAEGIYVREQYDDAYVPFTDNTYSHISSEMYCHTDVTYYDNVDHIPYPQFGETYHCVAFNALNSEPVSCPFEEQPGRTIVTFDDSARLFSNSSEANAKTSIATSLDAGTYTVSLASYDGYPGRENVSQPHEQFEVRLYAGGDGATLVAASGATDDLADNAFEAFFGGVVNPSLVLGQSVDTITAFHSEWYDNSSPNSLMPLCAAFDLQLNPF